MQSVSKRTRTNAHRIAQLSFGGDRTMCESKGRSVRKGGDNTCMCNSGLGAPSTKIAFPAAREGRLAPMSQITNDTSIAGYECAKSSSASDHSDCASTAATRASHLVDHVELVGCLLVSPAATHKKPSVNMSAVRDSHESTVEAQVSLHGTCGTHRQGLC